VVDSRRRATRRAVLVSSGSTVVCSLPLTLTGALAVQLTESLAFGIAQLGVAVAVYRTIHAVTANVMGRLADRVGARRSLRVAVLGASVASVGVGVAANSWAALVLWLAFGALARALCQPAANRMIVNSVNTGRQGLAFGVKQSATPASSMLAGLSVPLVALTIGWEWAYLLVAVLGAAISILIGRPTTGRVTAKQTAVVRKPLEHRTTLIVLSVAFGLGVGASSTIPVFFIDSAVRAGVTIDAAGYLLAASSLAAMMARVGTGTYADSL
jgi:MFS family permease